MLAARYLGLHRIEPVEVPRPEPQDEEALIRVDACGFCGSDIGIISGVHPRAQVPLTIGHELSGHIADIRTSNPQQLHTGDFVTLFPLISCGHCFACRNGHSHVCRTLRLYGFDVDGGMAEYVSVPITSLVKLPAAMPPQVGALIEPLAVAVHGVSRAPISDIHTAVIMGAGPIGLLTAIVARAQGINQILVSDILPSRIALAAEFGFRALPAGEPLKETVREITSGEGADVIFECAGASAGALEMTSLVRPRGTIINLSVFKTPPAVDMQAVNFKDLTIIGSRVYAREDFLQAISLAQTLPLHRIVTHSFRLQEVAAAFSCFLGGKDVCKVVVTP